MIATSFKLAVREDQLCQLLRTPEKETMAGGSVETSRVPSSSLEPFKNEAPAQQEAVFVRPGAR